MQPENNLEDKIRNWAKQYDIPQEKLAVLLQEISKYKQAEEELSQTRFQGILDIADDAIISVDRSQHITLFNQGAEKIFGYSAEEIMGQPLDLLLPESFRDAHRHHVSKFGKSAEKSRLIGERGEISGLRKNGEEFPAEASISKLTINNKKIYTVFLRDITERRKAEEALHKSNAMKDLWINTILHDLKNPGNVVVGALDMLVNKYQDLPLEEIKELLEMSKNSSNEFMEVLGYTTVFTQIVAGEPIEKEKINLAKLTRKVVKRYEQSLKRVTLRCDIQKDIQKVETHKIIKQVLRNYLTNADKYAPENDKITIKLYQDNKNVNIEVIDNGETIDEKYREAIFNRGFQLQKTTRGEGIGLSNAKQIAEAFDCEIGVKPNKPKGNIFYIKIPRR